MWRTDTYLQTQALLLLLVIFSDLVLAFREEI